MSAGSVYVIGKEKGSRGTVMSELNGKKKRDGERCKDKRGGLIWA